MADATITTTEHLEASQMPDTSWTWRRLLVYAVVLWSMLMGTWFSLVILNLASRTAQPQQLVVLGLLGIGLRFSFYGVWGGLVLYGVGASVTDVAKLVAAVKTTVRQTITTASAPATIQTEDAKVSTPAPPVEDPALQELPPWKR